MKAIIVYRRVMAMNIMSKKGRSAFFMVNGYLLGFPGINESAF